MEEEKINEGTPSPSGSHRNSEPTSKPLVISPSDPSPELNHGNYGGASDQFPFDISKLFNLSQLQYSFDTVKEALEWMATAQSRLVDRVADVEDHLDMLEGKFDDNPDKPDMTRRRSMEGTNLMSVSKQFDMSKQSVRRTGTIAPTSKRGSQLSHIDDVSNFSQTKDPTGREIRDMQEQIKKSKDLIFEGGMKHKNLAERYEATDREFKALKNTVEVVRQTADSAKNLAQLLDPTSIQRSMQDVVEEKVNQMRDRMTEDFQMKIDALWTRFKDFEKLEKNLATVDNEQQEMIEKLKKLQSGMANKINSISAQATSIISQDDNDKEDYKKPSDDDVFGLDNILVEMEKIWNVINKIRANKIDKEEVELKLFELRELIDGDMDGNRDETSSSHKRMSRKLSKAFISPKSSDDPFKVAAKFEELEQSVKQIQKEMASAGSLPTMKQQIQELQKKMNESISKDELKLIKNTLTQAQTQVDQFESEFKYFKEDLKQLKKVANKFNKAPSEEDFVLLRNRIDATENQDANMRKTLVDFDKRLKKLKPGQNSQDPSQEGTMIDRCIEEIRNLRQEYEDERDKIALNLKQLNEQALKKADRSDLAEIDGKVQARIQDNNKILLSQLASKEDTTKRFSQLSKRLRELVEMYAKTQQGEDEGMFTKKNLGPINCASCEKNLVNLQGIPVDYNAWKKLPFREPNERIARYAQGFSKMLSTLQPPEGTSISKLQHHNSQLGYLDRLSPFNSNPQLGNHNQSWDEHGGKVDQGASVASMPAGGDHFTHTTVHSSIVHNLNDPHNHLRMHQPTHDPTNFKTTVSFFRQGIGGQANPMLQQAHYNSQPGQLEQAMLDGGKRRHNSTIRNSRNGFGAMANTQYPVNLSPAKVINDSSEKKKLSLSPEANRSGMGAPAGEGGQGEATNINILPKLT